MIIWNAYVERFSNQLLVYITATNADFQQQVAFISNLSLNTFYFCNVKIVEFVKLCHFFCPFWCIIFLPTNVKSNTTEHFPFVYSVTIHHKLYLYFMMSFFLTTAVSQVHCCEDLTNDVLVFVWTYWSVLYLGRYLSLFRMAGLQAGTPSFSFMPCPLFFASLASLTAPLYWINSSCHFPCW